MEEDSIASQVEQKPELALQTTTVREILQKNPEKFTVLEKTVDQLRALRKNIPVSSDRLTPAHIEEKNVPPVESAYLAPPSTESQTPQEKVGYFLLPGATGTALANTAELREFVKQTEGKFPVGIAASLDSSASLGTTEQPFSTDVIVRASEQALLISELARTHGVNEVYLTGHSLGGMEATYVLCALQILDKDLKVGGLILSQPGGQYSFNVQDALRFALKGIPRFLSMKDEVRQVFPSAQDVADVQRDLEDAKVAQDPGKVLRIERELATMRIKQEDATSLLTPEQQAQLARLDTLLSNPPRGNEKNRLLEQRYKLLLPVIKNILRGDDPRTNSLRQELTMDLSTAKATKDILGVLPQTIRDAVRVPVAIAYSKKNDAYFQADVAGQRRDAMQLNQRIKEKKDAPYFPNSPLAMDATMEYMSHVGSVTDAENNMKIMLNIIERMREAKNNVGDKLAYERLRY